jgi:hypothetical protein
MCGLSVNSRKMENPCGFFFAWQMEALLSFHLFTYAKIDKIKHKLISDSSQCSRYEAVKP